MASALGTLGRQGSDFEAEKLSLKELSQDLMHKAPLVPHRSPGQKLSRLFATAPTSVLGIFLRLSPRLALWLGREVSELCLDDDILTRSRHNQSEKSHQKNIQTQHHGAIVHSPPFAHLSCAEHWTPSLFSQTVLLAAVINGGLFTLQLTPIFP